MTTVDQDDLVFLFAFNSQAAQIPIELFQFFILVYRQAEKGNTVSNLGYSEISHTEFLGSCDYAGFLYVKPANQVQKTSIYITAKDYSL